MWETLQSLDFDEKLALLAVFIPLASAALTGLVTVAFYFVTRRVEKRSAAEARAEEIDRVTLDNLKLDRERKRRELLSPLDEYLPSAREPTELLRGDILRADEASAELYKPSRAANIVCAVAATRPIVRAEGITEVAGDVVLQFSGGSDITLNVNVEISFNANVTNSMLENGRTGATLATDGDSTRRSSVYYGILEATNKLRFENIEVRRRSDGGVRQLRISNVRLNAAQLGLPGAAHSLPAGTSQYDVLAFVAVQPVDRAARPIYMNNELLSVARPVFAKLVSVQSPDDQDPDGRSCEKAAFENRALLSEPAGAKPALTLKMRFDEGFPGAFTAAEEEAAASLGPDTPVSVNGTRLLVQFRDVPKGVEVFVTARDVEKGTSQHSEGRPKAVWVSGANPNGDGGVLVFPGDFPKEVPRLEGGLPIVQVPLSGGFGWALWEWVCREPAPESLRKVSFGVVLAADPERPPSKRCADVTGLVAPLSTVMTASGRAPVPRFLDTHPAWKPAFGVYDEDPEDDIEGQD